MGILWRIQEGALGTLSFIFMEFSANILRNNKLMLRTQGLPLPMSGKSWIRHWDCLNCTVSRCSTLIFNIMNIFKEENIYLKTSCSNRLTHTEKKLTVNGTKSSKAWHPDFRGSFRLGRHSDLGGHRGSLRLGGQYRFVGGRGGHSDLQVLVCR